MEVFREDIASIQPGLKLPDFTVETDKGQE
jgi:hypothetical protein